MLQGCSDPILCRAHGPNCSQFPDEGPVLTPLLFLVGWNSPRNKKRGHVMQYGKPGPMCPSKLNNARRQELFINTQDLRRPEQDNHRGLLFGRVNAFLSPFLFYFTGTPEARTAPFPPPLTPPHPYFNNVSVIHSPIALASLNPKSTNLRLASTSLPFNSNPPFISVPSLFLSKLENHI